MESFKKLIHCILFFCFGLILEVICTTNGTFYNNPNEWPRLGNQNTFNINTNWPNYGLSSSTAWPKLNQQGEQRLSNQNGPIWVQTGQNFNRSFYQPQSVNPSYNIGFSSGSHFGNNSSNKNVGNRQNTSVLDDELRQLSETLLQRDSNNAAQHVVINYQTKTTSRSQTDQAPLPLLTIHNDAYYIPTIAKLKLLYDNYILHTTTPEQVTHEEEQEVNQFLDTILSTTVMQLTKNFLTEKGAIGRNPEEFRHILKEIWFDMYTRGGSKLGSSGFEHVFLGEIKRNTVSGLHNWLYFKEEEKRNTANYLGYLKIVSLNDKGAILKHHFKFHNIDKPVGSMFIGTSPELEMALYTTCFLLRADEVCRMRLAGHNFTIRTFTIRYKGKKLIGSAFPEI